MTVLVGAFNQKIALRRALVGAVIVKTDGSFAALLLTFPVCTVLPRSCNPSLHLPLTGLTIPELNRSQEEADDDDDPGCPEQGAGQGRGRGDTRRMSADVASLQRNRSPGLRETR